LMLDEPPLIVRMRGLAGFMDDSFVVRLDNGRMRCRIGYC